MGALSSPYRGRTYLRLYHDPDGESHFEEVEFSFREVETPSSSSPVLATPFEAATHHGVRIVPPGWKRDWAPAERRTLAVYLAGEGAIEASDGEVRRIGPGMMLLAEDTAGRGHRVWAIGDDPVVVVHIVLADER